MRTAFLVAVIAVLTTFLFAQDSPKASNPAPDAQESSSLDTKIDTSPPKDDAKDHPNSGSAVADLTPDAASDASGVQEFHPWNPMKANKDIQIGDFYFRRQNYKGALDRYTEALYYKNNDAVASYRIAECQEKLGNKAEARKYFEQYLKILPEGPLAKDAHASLAKLAKER
ncbi:MAG: tetratricopeptide repeat protein [Terriglobales bacterium]